MCVCVFLKLLSVLQSRTLPSADTQLMHNPPASATSRYLGLAKAETSLVTSNTRARSFPNLPKLSRPWRIKQDFLVGAVQLLVPPSLSRWELYRMYKVPSHPHSQLRIPPWIMQFGGKILISKAIWVKVSHCKGRCLERTGNGKVRKIW